MQIHNLELTLSLRFFLEPTRKPKTFRLVSIRNRCKKLILYRNLSNTKNTYFLHLLDTGRLWDQHCLLIVLDLIRPNPTFCSSVKFWYLLVSELEDFIKPSWSQYRWIGGAWPSIVSLESLLGRPARKGGNLILGIEPSAPRLSG